MISEPTSFALCRSIIKTEYFSENLKPTAKYILDFAEDFKTLPTTLQVSAVTNTKLELCETSTQQNKWFLTEVEKFCRLRAFESAIFDGANVLEKKGLAVAGPEVQARVQEALTISLMTDLGSSYFEDPMGRLERLKDRSNIISTSWKVLDKKLNGGFTKGTLNIFCGGSGSGKSLFLQNIARNWAMDGKYVVYISLELSEDLVNFRLDSMTTGLGTSGVMRDSTKAALVIKTIGMGKGIGDLKVKKFPEAGTTANDLKAYLKEYEIQMGRAPDALVVDYLDLMHPNNAKIDVSSMFTKDKYVSEELRAIGSEWQIPVVSASQLNRGSVEATEYDHSHIAGGISKINTADNVFAIYTSMSMKERGVYQLQFLKTRSASAVGQKIDLAYDPVSMVIKDPEGDEDDLLKPQTAQELRDNLRLRQAVSGGDEAPTMEKIEPQEGMSISQMAHPQHKSREQIEAEQQKHQPKASPKVTGMLDMIAASRKNNEN
jgi:archaellum biogenesis ATPase FlaH